MNKRILTIIIAIAVAFLLTALALPYYLGIKTQQSLDEQRILLSKNPFLVVEEHSYQRGWFTSTETMKVRFRPNFFAEVQQQLPDNVRTVLQQPITMVNHVRHGLFAGSISPVRGRVETEFKFTSQAQQILARFFGQQPPIKLQNTISLTGNGKLHITIPKFEYEELSGIKISWQGLDAMIHYTDGFNSFDNHTVSSGLNLILAKKGSASYQGLDFNSHTENGHTSISLGNSNLNVKQVSFEWHDSEDNAIRLDQLINLVTNLQIGAFVNPTGGNIPSKVSIGDLKLTTTTTEQDKWINSEGNFGFAKLQYGKDSYGPLDIDVAAEHLDAASLAALKNKLNQLSRQKLKNDQLQEAVVNAVRNEGVGLFTHDPLIKLNKFKLQMPQGLVDVHGTIGFKNLLASDMQQLGLMLDKTQSEMDFSIPQALLENFAVTQARALFTVDPSAGGAEALEDIDQTIRLMIDSAVKSMQSRGFVQVENGVVKTHMQLLHGKIYLNGKAFKNEQETGSDDLVEDASAPTVVASAT